MRASEFCTAALSFSGTRWQHQGRKPGTALDCIGLLVCAARMCGLDLEPQPPRYGPNRTGTEIRDALARVARQVEGAPMAGDLLALDPDAGGEPHHLGIALGPDSLIHTSILTRKVTVQPIDDDRRRRIHSVWRLNAMGGD